MLMKALYTNDCSERSKKASTNRFQTVVQEVRSTKLQTWKGCLQRWNFDLCEGAEFSIRLSHSDQCFYMSFQCRGSM